MDIVVNDTNIFIDLYSIGLLEAFCNLPYEIRTVDFVIAEIINTEQLKAISTFISEDKIKVESFDEEDLAEIITEHTKVPGNLSITDCSVCYYARKHSATLLTGDRQLRRYAEGNSVSVRGILFIFDELVASGVLTPLLASVKLKELLSVNMRLPKSEIENRIAAWGK